MTRRQANPQRKTKRQRQHHRRRPGSVLIMVVALLVLLALMGTAWIATVRNERSASTANVYNTQIEMLARGVGELVVAQAVRGAFGHDVTVNNPSSLLYRPRNGNGGKTYTYAGHDFVGFDWSTYFELGRTKNQSQGYMDQPLGYANQYLASRVPEKLEDGRIVWPAISAPLSSDGSGATQPWETEYLFESPYRASGSGPLEYSTRLNAEPTTVTVTVNGSAREYPALKIDGTTYLAADTDRDGIADAGLFRLPIGQQNGVTYYAAYRMVDDNAAVNVTTAMQWIDPNNADGLSRGGALMTNLFTSNVGVEHLIYDDASDSEKTRAKQMNRLNGQRFQYDPDAATLADFFQDINQNKPTDENSTTSPLPTLADYDYMSVYDMLWQELGRRVDNPGFNGHRTGAGGDPDRFRPVPLSAQLALADGFVLYNPDALSSLEEQLRPTLVDRGGREITKPYRATTSTDLAKWFENFDYSVYDYNKNTDDQIPFSRRPLFVARNGVSDAIAAAVSDAGTGGYPPEMDPNGGGGGYGDLPVKASLNDAKFHDLWRAYWSVMIGDPQDAEDPSPFGPENATTDVDPESIYYAMQWSVPSGGRTKYQTDQKRKNWRMFRPSIRPPSTAHKFNEALRFKPAEQIKLRAALAAANTIEMRSRGSSYAPDVPELTMNLHDPKSPTAPLEVKVRVYGNRPQPFISEVLAVNAPKIPANPATGTTEKDLPNGYIAVELYYPRDYPSGMTGGVSSLAGWKLVAIDRKKARRDPTKGNQDTGEVIHIYDFDETDPAPSFATDRFIVLENVKADADGNVTRPPGVQKPDGTIVYVEDLHLAFDRELVLVRPGYAPLGQDAAGTNTHDFVRRAVPVDSFDLTGLSRPSVTMTEAQVWHYARNTKESEPFRCVYPGVYQGDRDGKKLPRQQGTKVVDVTLSPEPSFRPISGVTLGSEQSSHYSDDEFTIQIANQHAPGPFGGASGRTYPFGGFARDGDVLHVPYIGAYVVYRELSPGQPNSAVELIEMNAVTTDSAFAEDTDDDNDEFENVGRFVPIIPTEFQQELPAFSAPPLANDPNPGANDFAVPDKGKTYSTRWRYRWAMRIFDYVTAQSPAADYQGDRPREDRPAGANRAVANVPNTPFGAANGALDRESGVQGRININTAPLPVLMTIPFAVKADGTIDLVENYEIAKAIVKFRDREGQVWTDDPQPQDLKHPLTGQKVGYGPFKSLFDLYRVERVRDYLDVMERVRAVEADDKGGDFTPFGAGKDGIDDDFEERFNFITRVSNMLTTRSDHFTAYVLVQGWRNVGTSQPELVSQRRYGLMIDRSSVTRSKKDARTTLIPME